MRLVFENWLISRGWVVALPLVALIAAAYLTGDLRLWMVVPVLICLIVPLLMVFVYYSYSLTPEAAAAIRPHRLRRESDGALTLTADADPEAGSKALSLRVEAADIAEVEEQASRLIIHLKDKPFRYIIIPNTSVNQQ